MLVMARRIGLFDPQLRPILRSHGLYYLRILFISTIMIWSFLGIFYGGVYKRPQYSGHLSIEIVDLDGSIVGRDISQLALQISRKEGAAKPSPTWRMRTDLDSLGRVNEWVRRHGWAALVINPGATARLEQAVISGGTYDPKNAMTVVTSTGHHPSIAMSYILPSLHAVLGQATAAFAMNQLRQGNLPSAGSNNLATLVTQPISFTMHEVAPLGFGLAPLFQILGLLVPLMCMLGLVLICRMLSYTFFVKVKHRDIWMTIALLIIAWASYLGLLLALAFSAFRGSNYNQYALPYTVGRFFSLWWTTAAVTAAVGLWIACWYLLLQPELLGLLSAFTVLSNVVSTLAPAEMMPGFYRWVFVLPFYHGTMLFHYILSGGYPKVGLNLSVILGDITAMICVLWLVALIRQYLIHLGIADVPGWYRTNMFYNSPIPYYKTQQKKYK